MKQILKEPLLHFLLIGGAIFAVAAWRGRTGDDQSLAPSAAATVDQPVVATEPRNGPGPIAPARIDIDAGVIQRLRDGWARQFNRTPTPDELRGLIEQQVKEEVLYREALAMGLDRDDSIVRRRLAQKMEFLTEDVTQFAPPDDAAVANYFEQHASRYAKPGRVSFRHIYFSRAKRGLAVDADAKAALTELVKSPKAEDAMGDPFLYEFELTDVTTAEISDALGPDFAWRLAGLPVGHWAGPVASSYGLHLVCLSARTAPQAAKLADVREMVLRDLVEARRQESNQLVLKNLKARYQIAVDEAAVKAQDSELLKPLGMAR